MVLFWYEKVKTYTELLYTRTRPRLTYTLLKLYKLHLFYLNCKGTDKRNEWDHKTENTQTSLDNYKQLQRKKNDEDNDVAMTHIWQVVQTTYKMSTRLDHTGTI
jgi:hypothetical protein